MESAELRELMTLMWDLVDQRLDLASAERLRLKLEADPAARRVYAEVLALSSALRSRYALGSQESGARLSLHDDGSDAFPRTAKRQAHSKMAHSEMAQHEMDDSAQPCPAGPPSMSGGSRPGWKPLSHLLEHRKTSLLASIAAVAVVFYGTFALLSLGLRPRIAMHENRVAEKVPARSAAVLTGGTDIVWAEGSRAPGLAEALMVGQTLKLAKGQAEITFDGGAKVDLQGPALLTIENVNKAQLAAGRLTAHVPKQAIGFAVQTPSLLVVDLGTSFGVDVSRWGDDQVHVFKGEVELRFRSPNSDVERQTPVRLHTGQALRVDKTKLAVETMESDSGRFYSAVKHSGPIDLPVAEAYVKAVKSSAPIVYWRFEELIKNRYIRNEMSAEWPARMCGAARIAGPWGYRRVLFSDNDALQCIKVDAPLSGIEDECSIELWVRPDKFHEGELVSLLVPNPSTQNGFDSFGAVELMPEDHPTFPARTVRFLHRNPPGNKDGTNLLCSGEYRIGEWQHIVATRSRNEMCLYLNGKLSSTTRLNLAPASVSPYVVIGRLYGEREIAEWQLESRQLSGQLDELAIYGRVLTAAEVKRHFELSDVSTTGPDT